MRARDYPILYFAAVDAPGSPGTLGQALSRLNQRMKLANQGIRLYHRGVRGSATDLSWATPRGNDSPVVQPAKPVP
jgi:hypothetical protein